jgi:hypothetical protein
MNFSEELKKVNLKKTSGPVKDYSNPKLAGFLTKSEIENYRFNVCECNFENWYQLLNSCTFKSIFCPIERDEAHFFVEAYESLFRDKPPEEILSLDWRELITNEQKRILDRLEAKLESYISSFTNNSPDQHVFVKTSSRSAKDSLLASEKFKRLYLESIREANYELRLQENEQIKCLLKAAFECLKMNSARQVLDCFLISERIYQDMLLALELPVVKFRENFIIREFVTIEVDMEFRGFVFNSKLNALSQYNYLIYSKVLIENKMLIQNKILKYFDGNIKEKLENHFSRNYVIDFAILKSIFIIFFLFNNSIYFLCFLYF